MRYEVVTEPKLAWAMALDTGVRSQLGPIIEDLQNGGGVQYSTRGGTGAAHGMAYAPIYARILRMEREQPATAAVGHVLCHPEASGCASWLDVAVETVESLTVSMIPNWEDGRAWKPAKKERVHYLVNVALMERRVNLSNAQPAWSPQRIGDCMADWHGMTIATRDWSRDWLPVWAVIQRAIDDIEADAIEPISEVIGQIIRKSRAA